MKKYLLVLAMFVFSCSKPITVDKLKANTVPTEEEMIFIPEGEIVVGKDIPEDEWKDMLSSMGSVSVPIIPFSERKVFVGAFYIAKYETTNAQLQQFLLAGGYEKSEYWTNEGWAYIKKHNFSVPKYWGKKIGKVYSTMEYPNHPALGTSWYEASAYAKWRDKRLPTEAEWEKAARGTDGREWPWGNVFDKFKCNAIESGLGATTVVGGYTGGGSPFGVMDLCGNVYEFTSEYLGTEKEMLQKYSAPNMPGGAVAIRGGSWDDFGEVNKMWRRFIASVEERERGRHNGIRLAMDAKD